MWTLRYCWKGRPVGGVSENGAAIAYHLQDSGAEVWTMRFGDSVPAL